MAPTTLVMPTTLITLVAGVVSLALARLQRRLIYLPTEAPPVPPAAHLLPDASEVTLHTNDGLALAAWHIPADGPGRGATVLVAGGNADNRAMRAPLAESLAARGLSVLLLDYRGYGGNPGSPTEEGLARDVRAARRYLVDDAGVPAGRLLYCGVSLGSAVVTELATEHAPAGLVLCAPFVDLASIGRIHYPFLPVRTLLQDRYPLADHLAHVAVPTTVVYGSADTIVPPEQSRAVAAAARGPAQLVTIHGADHNDPALLHGRKLVDAIVDLAHHAS